MAVAPEALQEALGWLQRGQLEEAEKRLAAVLGEEPNHFAARHLLGVVYLERGEHLRALGEFDLAAKSSPNVAIVFYNRGIALSSLHRFDEAAASYQQAVALRPEMAEAHYNLGLALRAMGRVEEAIASYKRAVAFKPGLYQAHNNLGHVLRELKRLPEALASFDQALVIKPDHVEAINNRGLVLHELRRLGEALASFERAIAIEPGRADAFNNRALLLQELGRADEAIASYDRAIALRPDHVDAWSNRGGVLAQMRRIDEAIASCDRAIALDAAHPGALNNRGIALHQGRRLEEALGSYERAISLKPDFAEAWNNRGNAMHDLRRMPEALASFQRAIDLNPKYAEAISNRGMVQQDLGRLEAARADYDAAIALRPGYAEALKRRAGLKLLQREFAGGWADFEASVGQVRAGLRDRPAIPFWNGESLAGKLILLSEPNGLGDTLQFIRFVPLLLERGAKVAFHGPVNFFRVLGAFSDRIRFVADSATDTFDFQCWLWSLPHYLGIGPEGLAACVPYLRAEPALVERWSHRLDRGHFNIGICWQGNPERKIDASRSIPLAKFFPVSQVPGVRLISLQKNFGLEQLQDLPAGMSVEVPGDGFDDGPDAFVDSAALLESLDLVIAPDTSINHLAGALGRPAWLALNHVPDWRWMLDRSDSPWYPSVRLFRQARIDDWDTVFEAMAEALPDLVRERGIDAGKGEP